jgi:2-succinyl-5-enolpyruvyl-6-hydroxy-3-cyclohexene-1-carboxylate synthase
MATTKGGGPVHINIPVVELYSFKSPALPDVQKIDYYTSENLPADELTAELQGKKVAVFIGSHGLFPRKAITAINQFVKAYDAPVFYDHTSSYTGNNRVLTSVAADLLQITDRPDVLIDIGSVCGDYSAARLFRAATTWRVSEDGAYYNRHNIQDLRKVFECSETLFFSSLAKRSAGSRYYSSLKKPAETITVPTMPLSNTYVSAKLAKAIPKRSFLHLGILNSLRNMDFFEVDKSVITSCNVGGFGIDGALSTLIGQSLSDKKRLAFGLLGDLAFFYDMNALGIRHIGHNLRILVINNGRGAEFRLNKALENQWGSDSDDLISAAGHFGSCRAWAESMGFAYMSARAKEEFDRQLAPFCDSNIEHFGKPVVFEVFTTIPDEQQALHHLRSVNQPIKKNLAKATP